MIKVNTKTLTATRTSIPQSLRGLTINTLRNLQTELSPVPLELQGIEFWDEVDATLPYDATTQMLDGTETLTCNAETKIVSVVRGMRAKTQEELDAQIERQREQYLVAVQSHLDTTAQKTKWDNMQSARATAGIPLLGDESSVEIAMYTDAVKLSRWYLKVWAYCYAQLDAIKAGSREIPVSVEAFILELPILGA